MPTEEPYCHLHYKVFTVYNLKNGNFFSRHDNTKSRVAPAASACKAAIVRRSSRIPKMLRPSFLCKPFYYVMKRHDDWNHIYFHFLPHTTREGSMVFLEHS